MSHGCAKGSIEITAFVAGGQFRNGILFAPAVADAICALVLGQPGHAEYRAFDPRRFAVP